MSFPKKKNKTVLSRLILILVMTFHVNTNAQISFQEHIITTDAGGASAVYSADLDNDGDLDILSASDIDHKIAWYKNDGSGNFGPQQIITTNVDGAAFVFASDIDSDGDIDVLSASENDDKIAWYENTDGQGNFGAQQIITTNTDNAIIVYAADIDSDGDMDVLSVSIIDNKLAWYENTDGNGSFGGQQVISTIGANSLFISDFDGDGDLDIVAGGGDINWYENTDGHGSFTLHSTLTTEVMWATGIHASDMDGDGDIDVISASWADDKIAWYENSDGLGNFGSQQIISTEGDGANSIFAVDLDGDNDMDILSCSSYDNTIEWYENIDGQANFGTRQIIATGSYSAPEMVYACDVDGDGDMDAVLASYNNNTIAWYENQGNLSVNHNQIYNFSIYPNPTKGILNIESQTPISKIEVYDQLGQLLLENTDTNTIDVSNLKQGLYLIRPDDKNGNFVIRKVIKK